MKKTILFLFLITTFQVFSQVTISPNPFSVDESITISVDINSNASDCNGFSSPNKVYVHLGVGPDSNPWTYVVGNWGQDDTVGLMNDDNNDGVWTITLNPKTYFGLTTEQANTITKMGMVFRNENGSQELKGNGCSDFFFDVGTFEVTLVAPTEDITILNAGESIVITALSNVVSDFNLKANGTSIHTATGIKTYNHSVVVNDDTTFILEATNNGQTISKTFEVILVPSSLVEEAVPAGLKNGINYNKDDNTKATLVLYAPHKHFVHLIGSFNNWTIDDVYLLKKDTANDRYWIELDGLTPQTNYTYQYMVDNKIKIADPYSTLVLTENDQGINSTTYPNLPAYPTGKTNHPVTLLKTGETPYTWQVSNFQKPAKTDLVIYELLIRDFDALHSFDAVKSRLDYLQNLGVNAIEFMPVNEFDNNESWGYNPSFHMALDKYYGTKNAFKQLIDECHSRGIAVILDVVYNQATGQNPYFRLWNTDNSGTGGVATSESPFFNAVSKHTYNVFNDMNHSTQATQDYIKRITQYWIDEFKVDGFRWDLTKGFTQNCEGNQSCTDSYNADRVAVLKQYADNQWEIDPNFYVIFEHLGDNTEETEWINYRLNEGKGIMVWGNHNYNYRFAVKGDNTQSDFSWISYKNRGWSVPANVSYMESHDEQRLMYEALTEGKSSGSYNIKTLTTALNRVKMAGAFFFTVPGPKLFWQFGEVGYDYSLYYNGSNTANKPIRWDYFDDLARKDVYNTWTKLIQLKKEYSVFKTNSFVMDVGNQDLKRISLTDDEASSNLRYVNIIGNFGVTAQDINPRFQQTGTWYDLLNDNATISVTDTHANITLEPGEFYVYGSAAVTLATEEYDLTGKKIIVYPNPTSNNFRISSTTKKVAIFDIVGRKVKEFEGDFNETYEFDISSLKRGIYIIKTDITNSLQKLIKN